MISLTVEYALRGVVWMASKPGVSQTAREIAAATQVPAGYLSKILNTLVNAGIITSQRGLGGGFLLARDPAALSVLEVINAVEPIERIHSCPLKLPAHAMQLCPLHRQLDAAIATVETAFSSCLEMAAEGMTDFEMRSISAVPDLNRSIQGIEQNTLGYEQII